MLLHVMRANAVMRQSQPGIDPYSCVLWQCTPAQEGLPCSLTLVVRRVGEDDSTAAAGAAADAVADEMESGRFWEGAEVEMPHEVLQDAAAGAVHEVCSPKKDILCCQTVLHCASNCTGSQQFGSSVDGNYGGGIGGGGFDGGGGGSGIGGGQ